MGWSYGNALVGEFMFTFLFIFTVFQTAVYSDCSSMASFAIGLAVFPAHALLIPLKVLHQSHLISRSSCRGVVHRTQEGHLPAHVGLLVWTISRRRSCSLIVVRSLKGSVPAPFSFLLHGIHIAQLVTQLMRHQEKNNTTPQTPTQMLSA